MLIETLLDGTHARASKKIRPQDAIEELWQAAREGQIKATAIEYKNAKALLGPDRNPRPLLAVLTPQRPGCNRGQPVQIPMIKARRMEADSTLLAPAHGPGKPGQDDRRYVSAFFYAAACNCSLESLPAAYGKARSLRTRRQRWEADGTLARLMEAGAPVIARLRAGYWGLIHDASLDWKNSSRSFLGKGVIPRAPHTEPRGRYADRRR